MSTTQLSLHTMYRHIQWLVDDAAAAHARLEDGAYRECSEYLRDIISDGTKLLEQLQDEEHAAYYHGR